MSKLVVVLPVAKFDWHLAKRWLMWIAHLAGKAGEGDQYDLVVLCTPALTDTQRDALSSWSPSGARVVVAREISEVGYFGTPNQVFKAAIEYVDKEFPGRPMLWCEADTVPMVPDWVSRIQEEYDGCGKPFMGDLCIIGQTKPHMTGNAVYPPNWRALAPSIAALPGPDPREGWDSQCCRETFPQAHGSKTIRQVWRPDPFTKTNWKKIVPPGCALFHQSKDGSLIDVLCEEAGIPPIPLDEPLCEPTYDLELRTAAPPVNAASTEILIVTCRRDFEFLRYCLLSIDKYARGFTGVTIVVPRAEFPTFKDLAFSGRNIKVLGFDEIPGKGMLHHEVQVCRADEWCPTAGAILHMDADCMFWKLVTPEDYMEGGRPIIVREKYAECGRRNTNRLFWRAAVEAAVGFTPVYETMVRHPNIYLRSLYPKMRAMVEEHTGQRFDDYVLSRQNSFPQGFAEYPTLGAVAIRHFAGSYTMVEYNHGLDRHECGLTHDQFQYIYRRDRDKMVEFWSHGGIQRYRADCENFLNGMLPRYVVK